MRLRRFAAIDADCRVEYDHRARLFSRGPAALTNEKAIDP
jgi:hypothetical protein